MGQEHRDDRVAADPPMESEEMMLLLHLRRHLKRNVVIVIGTVFAAILVSFIPPYVYRSRTTFIPEQPTQTGRADGLLGLASQLGVGIAGGGGNAQLYAELIKSVSLTDSVLVTKLEPSNATSGTIARLLVKESEPGTDSWTRARIALAAATSATVNPRTNVIELQIVLRDPAAAQLAARRYLTVLASFNRATRQTSARARREFLGRRLTEARDSLKAAERVQLEFFESNRGNLTASPSLRITNDGLQRRVQTAQDLFSSLNREYETARIDEVNDQPLLTVIDPPSFPTRRESAHRLLYLVTGFGIGVLWILSSAIAFVTIVRLHRTDPVRFRIIRDLFDRWPLLPHWIDRVVRSAN